MYVMKSFTERAILQKIIAKLKMAESAGGQYQDQFSCSICLDPLKEPVTIPCGHSYCMSCITDYWDQKDQEPQYRCPQCRETFTQRPLLRKNTLLAEMMEKLQMTSIQTASCSQEDSYVECDVECDVCTTEKNRAVKSCLQCLASFCETHLQLHYVSPAFMKHKLIDATTQVQENICLRHGKLLEIYCQDDSQCICYLCMIDNHKGHSVVSVESEWTKKKKLLERTKVKCQKMIQGRERAQQELCEAEKSFSSSAQEAIEDSEKIFTELICSLEKKHCEIKEQIRAQEQAEIDRAEDLHKQLNQELTELREREEDIKKLLFTNNQVHFLERFQSLFVLPTFEELPSITHQPRLYFKDISILAFKQVLEDICQQKTAKISQDVSYVDVAPSPEHKTPTEFLQYFCQLHLDPNTAHKNLRLSDENRKVSDSCKAQECPDNPERFDSIHNILCKEALYGRCYWEVECSGNELAVAVCYKGIQRKGKGKACKLGSNTKSWRLSRCLQKFYFRHGNENIHIPAACSSRIGVYLDHSAGTLSFYSVSDTMTLLYRVQTTFTELLYPAFGLGAGSSIQIIEQVGVQREQL